ncbi:MAG: glucose-1-phosphate cytidylyltransferase [Lentisphaerae bacterium]|nr:glucose-1-phosphate cytidylyltransferase [Lentisphaerota bacterium]
MTKVVILAGGLGTRLAEETVTKPKPMVEIGGQPILWHIMKIYAHYGFKEFFVALGYKGEVVKRYFLEYNNMSMDMTIDLSSGKIRKRGADNDDWVVHLIDTGPDSMTGGRVKRLEPLLKEEAFMVTYGDGVADIDLEALLDFHRAHRRLGTVTAVRPPSRFGGIKMEGDQVAKFTEKPQMGEGWINGGFMVLEPSIFKYLKTDASILEVDCLERLAKDGQLTAYRHEGFWQCMDTLRDKRFMERLWEEGKAPWKVWA